MEKKNKQHAGSFNSRDPNFKAYAEPAVDQTLFKYHQMRHKSLGSKHYCSEIYIIYIDKQGKPFLRTHILALKAIFLFNHGIHNTCIHLPTKVFKCLPIPLWKLSPKRKSGLL